MPSLKAILEETLRRAFSSTPEVPIHPQPPSQNQQALADLSDQDERPPTMTGVLPESLIHPQPPSQNQQALADLSDQDDRPPTMTGVLPESLVPPQPPSQNPIPSQPLANLSNQEDRLPITALSTGVYTITNVKNHNWAVLVNDDDR